MRFLHTSDWQLGLRRYYLDQDAQARYAADRFEAIRRLGELARREEAVCIVVAGDVFETNRVDRRTVLRALDAMGEAGVPVLLLPANHDPLDAASVYRSEAFRDGPANVRVLDGEEAVEVAPGFEVVGAPWTTKRPLADLVAERASRLEPRSGVLRVMVGHGAVDTLAPDPEEPAVIRVDDARRGLEEGRYHFLALGDRHSATQVDPRIWYSGSPEATDFDEERPGYVLRVDLEPGACRVEELEVGRWRFRRLAFRLAGEEDLEHLRGELEGLPDKPRTVLRLVLEGQLPLHARVDLDRLLDDARERFAAVDDRRESLALLPDQLDRDALDLGGYAAAAFEELLAEARAGAAPAGDAGAPGGPDSERSGAGPGDTGAEAPDGDAPTGTDAEPAGEERATDATDAAGFVGETRQDGTADPAAPAPAPTAAPAADVDPAQRRVAADALALLYRLAREEGR